MKKLIILLAVGIQVMTLSAQKDQRKEQFLKSFNRYRYEVSDSTLFERFLSLDFNKIRNDSAYAILLACFDKGTDGEFSTSLYDCVYSLFQEHPEEFSIFNSKIKYLPIKTQLHIKQELFEEMIYNHDLTTSGDGDYYTKAGRRQLEMNYHKEFPQSINLFPQAMHYSSGIIVYIHDRKDETANIRNAPNGEIISRLENKSVIQIDSIHGNWCRISENRILNKRDFHPIAPTDESELWVHSSCIDCKFAKSAGRNIFFYTNYEDKSTETIVKIGNDVIIDKILDLKDEWVKVKLKNGKIGWIENEELCRDCSSICE